MAWVPEPGEPCPGFIAEPSRCFRMVQSRQLHATHCREVPAWKGIWTDRKGNGWYIKACREHALKGDQPGVRKVCEPVLRMSWESSSAFLRPC